MPFANCVSETELLTVGQRMRNHTAEFITPVTCALSNDVGEPCGSGTFLQLRRKPYLLTNEHVAAERTQCRLAHFVGNGLQAAAIVHPFQCLTHPTDAALARIDEDIMAIGTKKAIPTKRLATEHAPAEGEIAFMHGYPGATSRFSAIAQGVLARTFPYATDFAALPPGYNPDLYFALSYPGTDEVKDFHGKRIYLPDPHGLSGTLVWNTQFVTSQGAVPWHPGLAIVTGLVWGWDEANHCLIATKIGILRGFFLEALRREAAYFRWLVRKPPGGDDWADWFWAEANLPDLM